MDLHPGEEIVFEGHPSWRSTLRFYVLGLLGAAVIGAIVGLVTAPTTGSLVWLVLFVTACRWWTPHPRRLPLLAVAAVVFWFLAVSAGVAWLGWTA